VLLQLGSHADPDGTNIWVGRDRMAKALDMPVRTLSYHFADLTTLKFLRAEGWHGKTRKRSLDLQEIFRAWERVQNSAATPEMSGPANACKIEPRRVQNRRERVQNSSGTQPSVVDLPADLPRERERNSTREKTARAALTPSEFEKSGKSNGNNGNSLVTKGSSDLAWSLYLTAQDERSRQERAEKQAAGIVVCQADGCPFSIFENSRGYCRNHRSLRPPCVQKKPAATAEAEECKELTRAS